ncbi:MAG: hypothetical protein CME71_12525 [Halobacteriovorax sp.]|nr:hypothetical protein [Halobacteriovorax sp.]
MMRFGLALFLISTNLFASHIETVCKSSKQPYPGRTNTWISNAPSFSSDYLSRRVVDDQGTRYVVETFTGDQIFESSTRVRDLIKTTESLWLLGDYDLTQIDFTGAILGTFPIVFNPNPQTAKAISMKLVVDILYIARGNAGLTAFNTMTGKIVWHSELDEVESSKPVSAAFDGTNLQVLMTSTREGGFNGVATVNLDGKVVGQTAYNQRRAGVISPDAIAHWHQDRLVVNNGGWIHIITSKQLADQKPIRPKWVAVEMGDDMHLHYMMLNGDFYLENNMLHGCGVYNERNGDEINRVARLFHVNLD